MKPLLSILIPSLKKREKQLNKLLFSLQKQITENSLEDKIEIIVYQDDAEVSVGHKGNVMIQMAKGLYIAGIADDDIVSDDYCKKICEAISKNPDVDQVTFGLRQKRKILPNLKYTFSYKNKKMVFNFLLFKILVSDFGKVDGSMFDMEFYIFNKKLFTITKKTFLNYFFLLFSVVFLTRVKGYSWCVMAIKNSIFKKVKFTDAPRSQDLEYIQKIRDMDLIKSETVIDDYLYFYNYRVNPDEIVWEKKDITLKNLIWV